jgi:hypothetical protein
MEKHTFERRSQCGLQLICRSVEDLFMEMSLAVDRIKREPPTPYNCKHINLRNYLLDHGQD